MTPNLDTDLLRTFVAIADSGGFTRAAELVHRTQSAVSMQMKRLEENVGRPLFERDGRNVTLTVEGETLLGYARRIMNLHEEALATLAEPDMVGLVRIGIPDDYVLRFMPGILARFAQCYPQVQVEVRCEPSANLGQALDNGALDLALMTHAGDTANGIVVRREQAVWVTSERHFVHEQNPLPLAVFEKGCFFRDWAQQRLDRSKRAYRIAYVSPSITGIQAVVTAGLAVTVLCQSAVPEGVRILGVNEGFPSLPSASIVLRQKHGQTSALIHCMARYISDGFRLDQSQAA